MSVDDTLLCSFQVGDNEITASSVGLTLSDPEACGEEGSEIRIRWCQRTASVVFPF